MNLIKQIIELAYYYRQDTAHGKPYWQDPTLIGIVVGLICTELVKFFGINIDADLQLKIVGVFTGIGALLSPHTGIVEEKDHLMTSVIDPPSVIAAREAAKQVRAQNRMESAVSDYGHEGDH